MKSGIYKIINIVNNKIYIGSTIDIDKRWWRHKNLLNRNKHHCHHLQRAWIKYGESNFILEILENVDIDNLLIKEQYWFNILNPEYNSCPMAGSSLGYKHSDETKEKLRLINLGDKNPNWKEEKSPQYIKKGYNYNVNYNIDYSYKEKAVFQIDIITGEILAEHKSITKAAKSLGLNRPVGIQHVLKGRRKSCQGFYWKFKDVS